MTDQLMDPDTWQMLDRVMQWLILPAVAFIWALSGRVSSAERDILRILTVLEERNKRRDEDREDTADAVKSLHGSIDKLIEKIDKIGDRT